MIVFDFLAKWNRTLVYLAPFRVIVGQSIEFIANSTFSVILATATAPMANDAFHLLAWRQLAIGLATSVCVSQRINEHIDLLLFGIFLLHNVRWACFWFLHFDWSIDGYTKALIGENSAKELHRNELLRKSNVSGGPLWSLSMIKQMICANKLFNGLKLDARMSWHVNAIADYFIRVIQSKAPNRFV